MNILFIIGSMREKSFNRQLANKTKELIGNRANISYLDYKNLPYMNQDLEANLPEEIKNIKDQVNKADAIWIFTPEYNGMIPGVLKNLLDWLSRPWIPGNYASGTPLKGKPVTFSGVGGRNQTKSCREMLNILLKRLGMKVMSEPSCGFSFTPEMQKTDTLELTNDDIQLLKDQIDAFLSFIKS